MKLAITRAIGDLNFKGYRKKDEELKEIMKEKSKSSFAELSLTDILRKGADMVISAEPEFKHYDVKKNNNKIVMMGCDGIWENDDADDKNINQAKWNIEKKSLKEIIIDNIFDKIYAKKPDADEGTDNMTCIIIKFK